MNLKEQYPFLKKANSTALQKSYDNLINAYKMVGKAGNGWVKFKSRKNPVQSFRTLNAKIIDGKLKLPKIKSLIKMKYSRKVKGDILLHQCQVSLPFFLRYWPILFHLLC